MSASNSLPIGPESPPGKAIPPPQTPIHGRHATLIPLARRHSKSLFRHIGGSSRAALWTYLPTPAPSSLQICEEVVESWMASTDFEYFVVCDQTSASTEEALGVISYLNVTPEHHRLEIGGIILGDVVKQTRIATEAFYHMIRKAFDEWCYLRVEWKCDSLNQPSKNAAARLGFIYEGTFRYIGQHSIGQEKHADSV